jgi:hypothetical protein
MKKQFLLVCVLLIFTSILFSQEKTGGKISGQVFGDYFFKVSGDSSGFAGQYASYRKSFQAFEFRRVALRYDHIFSNDFSGQISVESTDKVVTSGNYGFSVKTAYIEWRNLIPQAGITAGMSSTPTFVLAEGMWNYRAIEKNIFDFRGLGSSVDLGISVKGTFDKKTNYGYFVMIANGTGQKLENNKYKRYYASLYAKPVKGLIVEGYSDFEPNAGDKNKITVRGFAGYQGSSFAFGVEAFQKTQKKAFLDSLDVVPLGVSAFVWVNLIKKTTHPENRQILNAFARFDYFDPDSKVSDAGYRENFITAGIDYMPVKDVHIMPNIWVTSYTDKSSANLKKDANVIARLTFNYIYK